MISDSDWDTFGDSAAAVLTSCPTAKREGSGIEYARSVIYLRSRRFEPSGLSQTHLTVVSILLRLPEPE